MKGALPWRVDELEKLAAIFGVTLSDMVAPLPFATTLADGGDDGTPSERSVAAS